MHVKSGTCTCSYKALGTHCFLCSYNVLIPYAILAEGQVLRGLTYLSSCAITSVILSACPVLIGKCEFFL